MRCDNGDLAKAEMDAIGTVRVNGRAGRGTQRCPGVLEGRAVPSFGGTTGMGRAWLTGVTSCSFSQLGTAYVSATTGAVVTALGLKSLTKVRWSLAITVGGTWTLPVGSP